MYELLQRYMEVNRMYCMEGERGVRNLEKIVNAVGNYRSLDEFLADNSGAIEAVITWLSNLNNDEFSANLEQQVPEDEEEDEEEVTE